MHTKKYDLTEGKILSRLLMVAAPLMGTQLMQMAYNLTDMFWLGRVGLEAVAATGTAGMFIWLSTAFMFIGRMGAEIGVSQSVGRGDRIAAREFSQNAIFLGAVSGIVFGLFLILLRAPLIGFFNIYEESVVMGAKTYLSVVAIGMPFAFVSDAITGTFNGVGNSRIPFFINCLGLALNIVLSPVFIFVLDRGLAGAAMATVIAQGVVFLMSLCALRFLPGRPFADMRILHRPSPTQMRQILRWTLPITAQSAAFTFLSMIVGRFVAAFGADAIAIQRVGIQIESMSWLIAGGFSSALTSFVGQNYGRGRYDRIHRGARLALYTMLIWGVISTVVPLLLARQMFGLFLYGEEVLQEGVRFIRILSIGQLLICVEFWAQGMFRGFGKTLPPSIAVITGNTLRIPLAFFLSQTRLGISGLWWGIALGACMRGTLLLILYPLFARKLPQERIDLPEEPLPVEG